jgi:Skp family chaperone for outer membrane proteins
MSIRRIGGFNPSVAVQTAQLIESQRRVEAVEKHIGADDPELMTEEQKLEALNAHLQAELAEMEAERAAAERAATDLRSQLMNVDGFERNARGEPLDLKGGAEEEPRGLASAGTGGAGVSLAQLARAHVYATVQAQSAAEEAAALASAQQQAEGATPAEDDWMQAELAALQAEVEGAGDVDGAGEVDESQEAYNDPGADSFFASLEDIENLEEGGENFVDPGADAFVASLDDIAHLMTEAVEETAKPVNAEGLLEAPPTVVVDAFEAAPAPVMLPFDDEGGPGQG